MKKNIIKLLDDLDIKYHWVDHPPVFTVAESLETIDKTPIKNLLLQEKNHGRKILVVMAGDERLDAKLIREKLGTKKLQFANEQTLSETFGVKPGAVSVFGLLHEGAKGVEVVLDERVVHRGRELGFHPNDNTSTIFFSASQLEPIIKKLGHKYTLMKL